MDQQANILFPTATHWRPDALPNGFTGCSESDLLTESTGWNPAAWNSVHESEASWISHSLQSGHSCAPCFEADTPLLSPPWAENSDTASLSSTATGGLDLTTVAGTSEESTLGITHYNLPDSSFSSWEPGPYLLPQWDNPVTYAGFIGSTSEPTTTTTTSSSRPSPPEQTPASPSANLPQKQGRKKKRGRPRMYPEDSSSGTEKRLKPDYEPSIGTANATTNTSVASTMSGPDCGGLNQSTTNVSSSTTPAVRERNRAAAWRYRHKMQTQIQGLEAKEEEVTSRRRSLIAYADQLRGEVFDLKNRVMEHANCDFRPIQNYLSREVGQGWGLQNQNELGYGPVSFPGMG